MNFDKIKNIPKELITKRRWGCWRPPDKVPLSPPHKLQRAKVNDTNMWGFFKHALAYVRRDSSLGLGFLLGDGIIGVDIDHCRNPETGQLTEQAREIINTLNSYTEYSPSGTGVHIFCKGKLPQGGRRNGGLEMYSEGRFFTVTGDILDNAHTKIEDRTAELASVWGKYINGKKAGKSGTKPAKSVSKGPVFANDDDIITAAMNAKNGDLFAQLMNGNWKGRYQSQSEADIALCNLLAFYCRREEEQMDRIFRRSGLYREKWDEKHGEAGTYGQITINRAIADCAEVYTPPAPRGQPKRPPEPEEPPEIETGFDQLVKSEPENLFADTTTDLGRSKIFSEKYKNKLRFCNEMRSWFIWNNKFWECDKTLQVIQMAKDVVTEMVMRAGNEVAKAQGEEDVKAAKAKFRDTIKGKSEHSIKAMLELAKSDLPIKASEMDADPFLLNCQNGVVDLRTGNIIKHNSKFYITKIAGANYLPGKHFKIFDKFLMQITCDNQDLARYFQTICGMSAIGKVFFEGVCIFHGEGSNGKSTFLNTISKVFGDYAGSLKPELLMFSRDNRDPIGLADIMGKRFITAIETEEGKRVSCSMLKQLSSTDPITARRLYENPIKFYPSHTMILATNFLPKIPSTDRGTWRRIAVVPFKAKFEGENDIKDFASVLYGTDADAILGWIIEGAQQYIKNEYRIKVPEEVKKTTEIYRLDENWIQNFLQDCCEFNEKYEESGSLLYRTYVKWSEMNGENFKRRPSDFAKALEIEGYKKKRKSYGIVWYGLKVMDPGSDLPLPGECENHKVEVEDDDRFDKQSRMMM